MNQPTTSGQKPDRYVSFKGIDCDGQSRRLMLRIQDHASDPDQASPFWDYFLNKRTPPSGPQPDDLFLIHAHINALYELLEKAEDQEGLELLAWLEENCC